MSKQTINVGTNQDDGTGDLLRDAFVKVNANFTEIYTELGGSALSNISMTGSTISTDTANSDLIIDPNGIGSLLITGNTVATGNITASGGVSSNTLQVNTDANIDGNLVVDGTGTFGTLTINTANIPGALTVQGLFSATGNSVIGNSSADTLTVAARFNSSIVPSVTATNDLGGASLRWLNLYANGINLSGDATIAGNAIVGAVASNLEPSLDSTYNVGSSAKRYLDIFGDRFVGTSSEIGGLLVTNNTISSINTNGNITIDPQGTGILNVAGQLTVNGTFQVGTSRIIDMGANRIQAVAAPVATTDAVNKAYVDGLTGSFILTDDSSSSTSVAPGETLSVRGSGLATTNISANDTLTITVATQTLETVTNAGATTINGITVGSVDTDGIRIVDNNITTTRSNDDLMLLPNGTGKVVIGADRINVETPSTPVSANGASGDTKGDIAWDANYIYVCTADYNGATAVWKRTAISTWP